MTLFKKELFKRRIKLLFCYIKTGILFEFFHLWLFSPVFAMLFLSKIKLPGLNWVLWVLAVQCFIMFYFNVSLTSDDNFIVHKWFKKLEIKRDELCYSIEEEKAKREKTPDFDKAAEKLQNILKERNNKNE